MKQVFIAPILYAVFLALGWAAAANAAPAHPGPAGTSDNFLPLQLDQGWQYSWNNSRYAEEPITETVWADQRQGSAYTLRATNRFGDGTFDLSTTSGYRWDGYVTMGQMVFPLPLQMLFDFAFVPQQLLPAQWHVGDSWTGSGYWAGTTYTGTTTVVSDTAAVVAAGTTYTGCLQLHTEVTGFVSFGVGTRDVWLAPGVGVVKLVYHHADGSVTTGELVRRVTMRRTYVPLSWSTRVREEGVRLAGSGYHAPGAEHRKPLTISAGRTTLWSSSMRPWPTMNAR